MSSFEYNDLFIKCQKYAPDNMFTFDIKDSKKLDKKTRLEAQYKLINLATLLYTKIKTKEIKDKKRILVFDNNFLNLNKKRISFGIKTDPFILGDMFGITVYRDSITKEELMALFYNCKEILNINFDFHYMDGYYETNDWCEGKTKYFRGYCIQTLSELHKPYNKKLRKILKNNK